MTIQPTVRLAINADGPRIGEMHGPNKLDWSKVEPYWLVAELDNEIVGALQMQHGLPVGRLEELTIDAELNPRQRAMVWRQLALVGIRTLMENGSQLVALFIAFDDKQHKKMVKKHLNAKVHRSGNLMVVGTKW